MNDRLRLLPRDFLATWIATFHVLPPEDFLKMYETMCEGLYYGFMTRESWEGKPGGDKRNSRRADYFFADASLLDVKAQVDHRLAAISAALRRRFPQGRSDSAKGPGRVDRVHGASSGAAEGPPRDRGAA